MGSSGRPWLGRVLLTASLAATAALSGSRLLGYDPLPWGRVAVFLVGSLLLAGPLAWAVHARLPAARRERLGYVVAGVALLCLPFVLGVGLLSGALLETLDAAVFGGVVGFAVAVALERTVLPDRLRGTER
ncbi:hypothetical protein [Natronomonas marina]|uniref:hypothetical protein n=1 Tax=Natronomonas marina TaxID=2961939 RepID=UPI0020C93AE1|nr:hypothetical protein [Natronomonas marina]